MLRNIFVAAILTAGGLMSLKGPYYALLLYLWLAYFRPDTWLYYPWTVDLRVSLIVGTWAVISGLLFARDARLKFDAAFFLIVAAFAQTALSTYASLAPDWSWAWWSEFIKVLIIGVLIMAFVNTPWRFRTALLVLALGMGSEAVKQGWAQLLLNPGGQNNNEHPVLGDNNGVALGMFMLAPIVVALLRTSHWAAERWWHRLFLVGVLLRGITTYSRGGFLTALAVALLSLKNAKHRIATLLVIGVLAAGVLSVMPDTFWDRMRTINASDEERDASAAGRLHFWRVAQEMAKDRPLTGVGFNGFSHAYNHYDESGGAYGQYRAVHSTWFGILADTGYPGLAIFLSLILVSLYNTRRVLIVAKSTTHPELAAYAAALQAALVGFIVGGTFINGMYSELIWHLFCLCAALKYIVSDVAHGDARQMGTVDASSPVHPSAAEAFAQPLAR